MYRAFPPRLCTPNPGRQAPNPRLHALDERPVVRHCRVSLGDLPGARDFITFPGYVFGPAGIVRLCVCLAHARRGALRRRLPNHKDVVRIGVAFGGEGSSPALVALRGRVRSAPALDVRPQRVRRESLLGPLQRPSPALSDSPTAALSDSPTVGGGHGGRKRRDHPSCHRSWYWCRAHRLRRPFRSSSASALPRALDLGRPPRPDTTG